LVQVEAASGELAQVRRHLDARAATAERVQRRVAGDREQPFPKSCLLRTTAETLPCTQQGVLNRVLRGIIVT
jgi:hypothetical protein